MFMVGSGLGGKIGGLAAAGYRQWISRIAIDPFLVAAVLGGHALLVWRGWAPSLLNGIEVSTRPSLYAASAIVLSLTGTLGSLSVAQYLQARGDRARELKRRHPGVLATSWKIIFSCTILGSVLFLTAFRLDAAYVPVAKRPLVEGSTGEWFFEAGVLIALTAVVRLVALFSELVDLIVLDDTDPLSSPFEINPAMFEKPASTTTTAGSR
jgi:hypothetical protein